MSLDAKQLDELKLVLLVGISLFAGRSPQVAIRTARETLTLLERPGASDWRKVRIDELHMGVRLRKVLRRGAFETLGDVAALSPERFLLLKNCGPTTLGEMRLHLLAYGGSLDGDSPN